MVVVLSQIAQAIRNSLTPPSRAKLPMV